MIHFGIMFLVFSVSDYVFTNSEIKVTYKKNQKLEGYSFLSIHVLLSLEAGVPKAERNGGYTPQ